MLRLIRGPKYRVDVETGQVFSAATGRELVYDSNPHGYSYVRLYDGQQRYNLALARAIWMAATGRTIPRDFVIHHRNRDIEDNRFANLYCLHKADHVKLHADDLIESDEEIPF